MKVYALIDSDYEHCGIFSSVEKATEYAVKHYCHPKRKGAYWDSIEFLKTKMSKNGKYIDICFLYKKEGHEDEEGSAYTILVTEVD